MFLKFLLHVFLGLLLLLIARPAFTQNTFTNFTEEIEQFRLDYKLKFQNNEFSPLKDSSIEKLRFFKPDSTFKVICQFERTDEEKPFKIPTYNGGTHDYIKFGNLHFEIDGQTFQLSVYQILWMQRIPGKQNHLFVPFKDLTNGEQTYGGGRYLDLSILDLKENQITLDFNKCYNPYCAYSDGYSCPIPPPENHLDINIKAGELDFIKN